MALSESVKRTLIHTRKIKCRGYLREDELWDIEAHLTDVKTQTFKGIERGDIIAGEPIHEMLFRLTMDDQLVIHKAETETLKSPFTICPDINDNYHLLEGKQIAPGWNAMVKNLFSGTKGCTHLTELLSVMATTAFQTIFPYKNAQSRHKNDEQRLSNYLKNSCYGFDTKGKIVSQHWPLDKT